MLPAFLLDKEQMEFAQNRCKFYLLERYLLWMLSTNLSSALTLRPTWILLQAISMISKEEGIKGYWKGNLPQVPSIFKHCISIGNNQTEI